MLIKSIRATMSSCFVDRIFFLTQCCCCCFIFFKFGFDLFEKFEVIFSCGIPNMSMFNLWMQITVNWECMLVGQTYRVRCEPPAEVNKLHRNTKLVPMRQIWITRRNSKWTNFGHATPICGISLFLFFCFIFLRCRVVVAVVALLLLLLLTV